jgi:iron-sulfur cluster assembly protein
LEEAQKVRNSDISEALKLPEIKRHCSVLAEEVLVAAVQDFRRKQAGCEVDIEQISLTLTPRAIAKARFFLEKKTPPAAGLRVSVARQGCAGLSYVLDCAETRNAEEVQIDAGGVALFIDPLVMPFLNGTQIDYVEENLKAGFVFNNPNACGQCSCGQSFRTTREEGAVTESKGKCAGSSCVSRVH